MTNLLVCEDDTDDSDPYLLPPRQPDAIALRDYSFDQPLDGSTAIVPLIAVTPTPDPVSTVNDIVIVVTISPDDTTES
jgi:hypothetical protein